MLGKLARWLVLLGYDAKFAGGAGRPDLELLEEAQREGRVFVTRDRGVPAVAGVRMVVITHAALEDQLKQIAAELPLKPDPALLFTRCPDCNSPLETLAREEALPLVPQKVRELQTPFRRCLKCARLYWNGTHTARILEKVRALGL